MRFEKVFRDLEVRLAAERVRDLELDARQTARSAYSSVTMVERLSAHLGGSIRICGADTRVREGLLESVGDGWVQVNAMGESVILPLPGVLWWEGSELALRADVRQKVYRLTLPLALRALATSRELVKIYMAHGGVACEGVIERVGADFVELKVLTGGEYPRSDSWRGAQKGVRIIPTPLIGAVVARS